MPITTADPGQHGHHIPVLPNDLDPQTKQENFESEIAASNVDMVVVHPMQMEDGCPLEPRIRQLHPIPFSQVPIPF